MSDQVFITEEITNQDIYKKLNNMSETQVEILSHAKFTNGKIADNILKIATLEKALEEKANKKDSIGVWINSHPFKFAGLALIFVTFIIGDLRNPLISFIMSLI